MVYLQKTDRARRAVRSNTPRTIGTMFVGLAGAIALAGPGLVSSIHAATVQVYVFEFDFSTKLPGETITDPTINLGDTIRWVWLDDHHTSTAALNQTDYWQSDLFDAGDSFEYTFEKPGVFWYYCEPHGFDRGDGTAAGMAGTITVVPSPGGAMIAGAALLPLMARRRRLARLWDSGFECRDHSVIGSEVTTVPVA